MDSDTLCTSTVVKASHCPVVLEKSIFPPFTMASMRLDFPIVPTMTAGPQGKASDRLDTFETVPLVPVTCPKSRARSPAARETPAQSAVSMETDGELLASARRMLPLVLSN